MFFERRAGKSLSPSPSAYLSLARGKRKGGRIVHLRPEKAEFFFLIVNRSGQKENYEKTT
jgi:hypothetical protein